MTQEEREELRALGERLIVMAGAPDGHPGPIGDYLSFAREELRRRRARETVMPREFFGEPVWNILLDLFVAAGERRRLCVTDIFVFAGASATSTLRYLRVLEAAGYLSRSPDPADSRRTFVGLTEFGSTTVRQTLAMMAPLEGVKQLS